jgi:sterol desaturase/sphingolipid hydroxylase (fatty acid hydroxylase superfamily)
MSTPISLQIFLGFMMFALVFVPLERCLPLRHQRVLRAGWITDVIYYVVGCFVGRLSDAISFGAMFLILQATELDSQGLAATQPGWLQFLEILIIADFLAYWYHRFIHSCSWLWGLHKIHHSSKRLDWLANVRLHPVDKIFGDCAQFIPIFLIGFSDGPLLAYTIFLGFQGFLNHSNINIKFGFLRWIFVTPEFHHWHHCDHPASYNRNFAPHLVVCDLLFGTAYFPPDRSMPKQYGIAEPVPGGFWRQFVEPLRWAKISN